MPETMLTPESLPLTPVGMDHGGGILAMVMGSGLVVQSVLLILIALSVWSWARIVCNGSLSSALASNATDS
jgi:hypothetical protein